MKFGKLAPKHGKLQLSKYLDHTVLPAPPERMAWSTKASASWGMMKNDTVGDCTCAAVGHLIQGWTANMGHEVTISDRAVLKAYEDVTGYDPRDPNSDQGAVVLDVLKYWQKRGIGGHKLGAYAEIQPAHHKGWDPRLIQDALFLFVGCDIGFQVPQSAMDQIDHHQMWTVETDDGGIVGGHSVAVFDYDPQGLSCVTWGTVQKMSWAFWQKYCDEAWALISPDFLAAGKAPNGFDLAALQADLRAVTA